MDSSGNSVPEQGLRVGGMDEDIVGLLEIPFVLLVATQFHHLLHHPVQANTAFALHEWNLVLAELQQFYEQATRKSGYPFQTQTFYPRLQLHEIDLVACFAKEHPQISYLLQQDAFVKKVTPYILQQQQQRQCGRE